MSFFYQTKFSKVHTELNIQKYAFLPSVLDWMYYVKHDETKDDLLQSCTVLLHRANISHVGYICCKSDAISPQTCLVIDNDCRLLY